MPTFAEFTNQWYDEMSIGWRNSYKKAISSMLKLRLIPAFGDKKICDIQKTDVLQTQLCSCTATLPYFL